MKRQFYTLLLFMGLFINAPMSSAIVKATVSTATLTPTDIVTLTDFVNLSALDIQQKLNRPLTNKEKLAHKYLNGRLRREIAKHPELGNVSVNAFFQDCARIVLKSGEIIEAKISQIGQTQIQYRKCGAADSPMISISKEDVLSVMSATGEMIYKNPNPATSNAGQTIVIKEKRTNVFVIILAVLGALVLLGLLLGSAGA